MLPRFRFEYPKCDLLKPDYDLLTLGYSAPYGRAKFLSIRLQSDYDNGLFIHHCYPSNFQSVFGPITTCDRRENRLPDVYFQSVFGPITTPFTQGSSRHCSSSFNPSSVRLRRSFSAVRGLLSHLSIRLRSDYDVFAIRFESTPTDTFNPSSVRLRLELSGIVVLATDVLSIRLRSNYDPWYLALHCPQANFQSVFGPITTR